MTSLPCPVPPVQDSDEDDYFTVRLRGLSPQQLLEAMTFLAWWSPGTFTGVLDYCEAGNWGTDDFDPDPGHAPEGDRRTPTTAATP